MGIASLGGGPDCRAPGILETFPARWKEKFPPARTARGAIWADRIALGWMLHTSPLGAKTERKISPGQSGRDQRSSHSGAENAGRCAMNERRGTLLLPHVCRIRWD